MSVHHNQTPGRDASSDQRMRASEPVSDRRFRGLDEELADLRRRCRKRPRSPDTVEKPPPAKLDCRKRDVGGHVRSIAADDRKPTAEERAVGVESKPTRPAENLTVGTPFDLVSYLDEARKTTRRDFDPDSVTVVRQLNEGCCPLHTRPEFNSSEASSFSQELEVDINTSPLSLCDTDIDCAGRLGVLIAASVEQHVDMTKLEETARSVSHHRLRHGTTVDTEREIVRRHRPVLISTVPSRPTSRHKLPSANIGIVSCRQPAGYIATLCHPNVLGASQSASHHLSLVGKGREGGQQRVNVSSGQDFRAADRTTSSSVCRSVIMPSAEETLSGSGDTKTARPMIAGRNATRDDSHLRLDIWPHSRCNTEQDNRSGFCHSLNT